MPPCRKGPGLEARLPTSWTGLSPRELCGAVESRLAGIQACSFSPVTPGVPLPLFPHPCSGHEVGGGGVTAPQVGRRPLGWGGGWNQPRAVGVRVGEVTGDHLGALRAQSSLGPGIDVSVDGRIIQ